MPKHYVFNVATGPAWVDGPAEPPLPESKPVTLEDALIKKGLITKADLEAV